MAGRTGKQKALYLGVLVEWSVHGMLVPLESIIILVLSAAADSTLSSKLVL